MLTDRGLAIEGKKKKKGSHLSKLKWSRRGRKKGKQAGVVHRFVKEKKMKCRSTHAGREKVGIDGGC